VKAADTRPADTRTPIARAMYAHDWSGTGRANSRKRWADVIAHLTKHGDHEAAAVALRIATMPRR